jgi:hypothetical protein
MRTPAILALVVAASFAGACTSSNVYETKNARPNAIEFDSKISNPFLKGRVDVTSCYVGQTPDGVLRVQVNIENHTGGKRPVHVCVHLV